jgi:predicted RNase H-like HicB family nuclease
MGLVETVTVLIEPSDEIAGEWVAHVLELDAVTQGRSVAHALEMAEEAAGIVLTESAAPRRRAPEPEWERAYGLMREGERIPLDQLEHPSAAIEALVAVVEVSVATSTGAPRAWFARLAA